MSDPIAVSRRLVAVFAADVEGYSRLMGDDEIGTLKGLTERRAILDGLITDHRGRLRATVFLPNLEAPLTRCNAPWRRKLRLPMRTPASPLTSASISASACTSATC